MVIVMDWKGNVMTMQPFLALYVSLRSLMTANKLCLHIHFSSVGTKESRLRSSLEPYELQRML